MIKPQRWYVEQVSDSDQKEKEWRYIQVTGDNGAVRSFSSICQSGNVRSLCQGNIHFCFNPKESYLYNDEFPQLKPDLLEMQIHKRFSDRGQTMDPGNFNHRSKTIDGQTGWLNCLFVPRAELKEHIDFVQPWNKIRSCTLVPTEASVAALFHQVTDRAVLVFLLTRTTSQVLVVRGGIPLYSQSLTLSKPGVVDEALIPHAVDFARTSLRKDHNIDEVHITRLGQARDSINLHNLEIEEWTPDFSKVIAPQSQEDVLLHPQLFGAGYVDDSYNFLPKEFGHSWRLQSFSFRTSICAGIIAAALFVYWLYLQPSLDKQRLLYQTLSTSVNQEQRELRRRIPPTANLDIFDRLVTIRNQAEKDFRLDSLMEKLSVALGGMARITSLKVRRQTDGTISATGPLPGFEHEDPTAGLPGSGLTASALSAVELLQGKHIIVALTCSTEGSYEQVTARFESVVIGLNTFFTVQDTNWSYKEADKTGLLNCELLPKKRGLQP